MDGQIVIKGARENNLKSIDLILPKNKLIVMTGLSGSGKSSLAFDTIYEEGRRRYVESLSAYARQFLGNMEKPDVDSIEGLSPAISIDQKTTSNNPRSTVGTVTEIYDYLRLLYARIGHPFCPEHGIEIARQTIQEMTNKILEHDGAKVLILSPVVRGKKGAQEKTLIDLRHNGFNRIRLNGEYHDLDEEIILEKTKRYDIEVVIDRIVVKEGIRSRLYDSIETACKRSEGLMIAVIDDVETRFSENYSCPYCGFTISKLEPRLFSFNSPYGACPDCSGLGFTRKIDTNLLIENDKLSMSKGVLDKYANTESLYYQMVAQAAIAHGIDVDKPFRELTDEEKKIIFYGSRKLVHYKFLSKSSEYEHNQKKAFEGVVNSLERRYIETTSKMIRDWIETMMNDIPCERCHGKRLSEEALSVKVDGKNIEEVTAMTIENHLAHIDALHLSERDHEIARPILREIKTRLQFLSNVGLEYLSLSRSAGTLSGGESQRIRLATQIGSRLTGVLYVLDEPSIGLHQRDNHRLIDTMKDMRDIGNTMIVVEHDMEMIESADFVVDIGPGAGIHGGEVMFAGSPEDIKNCPQSITGQYLSGKLSIPVPAIRRIPTRGFVTIKGARQNNLKNIDVQIPVGLFTVVTGVSGSGKSSLVNEVLYKGLLNRITKRSEVAGLCDDILGYKIFDKIIDIDQSAIGRTPRSNPATYTGVFDEIRDIFAMTNEAKTRGYDKSRFSFNVKGGRCEQCGGDGVIKIEMHFMPDIYVQCDQCRGKRYNQETLDVKYKGKSVADVLDMTIEDAVPFFQNIPKIHTRLKTINDVGLGYIKLGQSSVTLSGGEAQRVKLASELYKRITDKSIYILDEPTTGLHSHDIVNLLKVLQDIVEAGATVVVIEHNLDVIKVADHVIDLGPEGGDKGGEVVFIGTPEEVAKCPHSYTGQYLRKVLAGGI